MDGSIDLGEELEAVVEEALGSGRYASRDDVIREGVRLVGLNEKRRVELEADIAEGLADIEAGRVHDLEDVARELRARYVGEPPDRAA